MKEKSFNRSRSLIFGLFLGAGAVACAHPGPAGHHHHPDEVDEFDQVVAPVEAPTHTRDIIVGGVLALGATACAGYFFFLKSGGLKDAAPRH